MKSLCVLVGVVMLALQLATVEAQHFTGIAQIQQGFEWYVCSDHPISTITYSAAIAPVGAVANPTFGNSQKGYYITFTGPTVGSVEFISIAKTDLASLFDPAIANITTISGASCTSPVPSCQMVAAPLVPSNIIVCFAVLNTQPNSVTVTVDVDFGPSTGGTQSSAPAYVPSTSGAPTYTPSSGATSGIPTYTPPSGTNQPIGTPLPGPVGSLPVSSSSTPMVSPNVFGTFIILTISWFTVPFLFA